MSNPLLEKYQGKAISPHEDAILAKLSGKSEVELYEQGLAALQEALQVLIRPSVGSSANCNLQLYSLDPFVGEPGITPPEGFRHGRVLSEARYRELLRIWRTVLQQLPDLEVADFWLPVLSAIESGASPIGRFVGRLISVNSAYNAQYEGLEGYEQGIAISPAQAIASGEHPRAFLPETDWFDQRIRLLKPEHIITLFPQAELDMFLLFIGRTVCGRSNSRPVGSTKLLSHQYRKMALLYGKDPRTGKSTTIRWLINAMRKCGYWAMPFRSIGDRFNQGDLAQADFVYKDDTTQKSIADILDTDMLKMLISGAQVRCENKGQNAYSVTPNCTVLAITNSFDQSSLWKHDAGVLDRLAVLYTYSEAELTSMKLDVPGIGLSPNVRAYEHITWLADQLGTSPEVLMMWVLRCSADMFLEHCEANTLEQYIGAQADKLRFPIAHQVLPNVVAGMLFAQSLKYGNKPVPLSNKRTLAYVLGAYAYLVADPNAHLLRNLLHQDYCAKGRPKLHPWRGIGMISKVSIGPMMLEVQNCVSNQNHNLADMVQRCFGALKTDDGINIGNSNYYISRAWCELSVDFQAAGIQQLASNVLISFKAMPNTELMLERLTSNTLCSLDYTESVGFDPREISSTLQNMYEDAVARGESINLERSLTNMLTDCNKL